MKTPARIIVIFLVAKAVITFLSHNSDKTKTPPPEQPGGTSTAAAPYACGPSFFAGGCSLR